MTLLWNRWRATGGELMCSDKSAVIRTLANTQGFRVGFLRWRSWTIIVFQAALISGCLAFAWLLRFDFAFPQYRLMLAALPVLLVLRLLAIWRYNLLHGWWQYTGISDALDVGRAVFAGSVAFFVVFRLILGQIHFPLSVYLIEMGLTMFALCGVRLCSRLLAESVIRDRDSKRLLLIGAGHAAGLVIRETRHIYTGYTVVGCVDDDPTKQGMNIHGVPVLGTIDDLPRVAKREEPDEVLITVPSASSQQMLRFAEICERTGLRFRTVPALCDWIAGKEAMAQIREVSLEDLLGREPVKLNLEFVRDHMQNRVVMVTGAAGSIGSELCRQLVGYQPALLLCVDQSETGMFHLEAELSKLPQHPPIIYSVTDIGEAGPMRKLFLRHKVDTIFHAAAYKHVPLMEINVQQAVSNNVFGLMKLLEVAEEGGCKTFVQISTDKAVNPTSIMGATKRICELLVGAWPTRQIRCVTVRFGNVLGSNGSVIPTFQKQLREAQPITVTHPEVKRFFMTIPEAVSLVLQASVIGTHRDILVLDMGEPVCILDLAKMLISLSGKGRDQVPIQFTGLRMGEKLEEELFYRDEVPLPTSCPKIQRAHNAAMEWRELRLHLAGLRASLSVDGPDPIRRKIQEIVPEYTDGSRPHIVPELPEVARLAVVGQAAGSNGHGNGNGASSQPAAAVPWIAAAEARGNGRFHAPNPALNGGNGGAWPNPAPRGKTILITGGGGFLGSSLAEKLAEENRLVLLDQSFAPAPIQYTSLLKRPNVTAVAGNILDLDLRGLVREANIVVHAAALSGATRARKADRETLETSYLGTLHLLKALESSQTIERFVYVSASEVLGVNSNGLGEAGQPILDPLAEPRWSRAMSELAAEHLVAAYATQLPIAIVRPFHVFGPRQIGRDLLHRFVLNALGNQPLELHGDGTQSRAWCFIEDLCTALLQMMSHPEAVGEDFNIGNPSNAVTFAELARRVIRLADSSSPIVFREAPLREIPAPVPSLEKAWRLLSFAPRYDLDTGLALTIEWCRENLSSLQAARLPADDISVAA
jgi:FlaA1/EpsC-like NDP-sugar epimerase